jgi:hypothetical protein
MKFFILLTLPIHRRSRIARNRIPRASLRLRALGSWSNPAVRPLWGISSGLLLPGVTRDPAVADRYGRLRQVTVSYGRLRLNFFHRHRNTCCPQPSLPLTSTGFPVMMTCAGLTRVPQPATPRSRSPNRCSVLHCVAVCCTVFRQKFLSRALQHLSSRHKYTLDTARETAQSQVTLA